MLPDQMEAWVERLEQDGCEGCGSGDVRVEADEVRAGVWWVECADCGRTRQVTEP